MAPINIQSQEYRDLLDIIDKLRLQGLDHYVGLPEIIVCGDQSTGKSSVLEAISGLSFPTKETLCTRFATELILRRDPARAIKVSIIPHHSRSTGEKAALNAFTAGVDPDHPDLGPVVEEAKKAMGLSDDKTGDKTKRQFSNDVLRIELSGPEQQHLTLVDLPGFYVAGNTEQSEDEVPVVRKLVLGYMKRPRSVILAVVSASNDFANQAVTAFSRKLDPKGIRTMGLITKPDKLDENSDSQRHFLKLAENKDVILQLGWHVLKNRSFEMRHASSTERDESEKAFFASGAWATINPAHLGVGNLRPRLSTILKNQILSQLPTMLQDIEALLDDCSHRLAKLGAPRDTIREQQQYLSRVSRDFTSLLTAAVDGSYADTEFFGSVLDEDGYEKRLRAVVQNRLIQFAKTMHEDGRTQSIVDHEERELKEDEISRSDFVEEVRKMMDKSRGRELPGTFNPLVVGDLFRWQSQPWAKLAEECADDVVRSAFKTIVTALDHVTVPDTAEKILLKHINPAMDALKRNLADEIAKLLAPHKEGHPITYNHYLMENVQKARAQRMHRQLSTALGSAFDVEDMSSRSLLHKTIHPAEFLALMTTEMEPNMDILASSDAIDYMEAYYKVAMKKFIDDVGVLALEQCLIRKLPLLFTPDMIYGITDADILHLATETSETIAERALLNEKKAILETGLQELRRLDKHRDLLPNGVPHLHEEGPEDDSEEGGPGTSAESTGSPGPSRPASPEAEKPQEIPAVEEEPRPLAEWYGFVGKPVKKRRGRVF